jgi:hypothetical protein
MDASEISVAAKDRVPQLRRGRAPDLRAQSKGYRPAVRRAAGCCRAPGRRREQAALSQLKAVRGSAGLGVEPHENAAPFKKLLSPVLQYARPRPTVGVALVISRTTPTAWVR